MLNWRSASWFSDDEPRRPARRGQWWVDYIEARKHELAHYEDLLVAIAKHLKDESHALQPNGDAQPDYERLQRHLKTRIFFLKKGLKDDEIDI